MQQEKPLSEYHMRYFEEVSFSASFGHFSPLTSSLSIFVFAMLHLHTVQMLRQCLATPLTCKAHPPQPYVIYNQPKREEIYDGMVSGGETETRTRWS